MDAPLTSEFSPNSLFSVGMCRSPPPLPRSVTGRCFWHSKREALRDAPEVCLRVLFSLYRAVIQLWGEETLQLLFPVPHVEGVVLRHTGINLFPLGHQEQIHSLIPSSSTVDRDPALGELTHALIHVRSFRIERKQENLEEPHRNPMQTLIHLAARQRNWPVMDMHLVIL